MSSPRAKKVKGRSKAYYNRIAQRALALRNSELRSSGGANPRRYSVSVKPGQAGAALGTCHRNENCLPGLNSAQNIAFSSCKWLSPKRGNFDEKKKPMKLVLETKPYKLISHYNYPL